VVYGNAHGNIAQISFFLRQMYARRPTEIVIRQARDDDVLPAFRRRCSFAIVAPARQMAHSAGMSGMRAPE
jgi:hypothetical protein